MTCPKCGTAMIGIEYPLGHPEHYDGVSEWDCPKCKIRIGRWSKRILQNGKCEQPFGGK